MRHHIFEEISQVSIRAKVNFIQKFLTEHSLKILLWAVKLARSTYFEFINRKKSKQSENMVARRKLVEEIFHENDSIYGARKIKVLLEDHDVFVTVRTVSNDLKALNLQSCYVKRHKPKIAVSSDRICVNYLKDTETTTPHQHIVTDITYIYTLKDSWVYQLTFMDVFTRKVLHFDISKSMDSDFVNENVKVLLKRYPKIKILHSDRGSQFTANSYCEILENYGVLASYSAKGYPYDNAIIESYHASLKIERIYRLKIRDLNHAFSVVFQYNYGFYNSRRIHQSLGYITPNTFERMAIAG